MENQNIFTGTPSYKRNVNPMGFNCLRMNTVLDKPITSEMIKQAYNDMSKVVSTLHKDVSDNFEFTLIEGESLIVFNDFKNKEELFGIVPENIWSQLSETEVTLSSQIAQTSCNGMLNTNGEGKAAYIVDGWMDFMIRLYLVCLRKYVMFNYYEDERDYFNDYYFDKGFKLPKFDCSFEWVECFEIEIEPVLREHGLMNI